MPEVIIKYKKPETLKILKGLAKYLDFKVSKEKANEYSVNGVTIVKRDLDADPLDMRQLFTDKNVDAKTLRKKAWQRKK